MSDDFEGRVRDWLRERGRTSDHELRALAGNVAVLPPRRPRRFRPLLAVAVVAVAVVGAWTLVPRFGQVGGEPAASPVPPDPAAFAGDPRLSRCGVPLATPLYAFELAHAGDYHRHLPAMLLAPELDVDDPAFVVVFDGPQPFGLSGGPGPPSSNEPGNHDVCILVGHDPATATLNIYGNVDVSGLTAEADHASHSPDAAHASSRPSHSAEPSGEPSAGAAPASTATAHPSTSWPPGCGPSNLDITESPASPGWGRAESPLLARDTVVPTFEDLPTHAFHPLRPDEPEGRPLQHILLIGNSNISLLYAREPLDDADTLIDAYRKGTFGLTQRPFAGQDADFVLENAPRDSWRVEVGPYPAALVLGTPLTTTIRPYGLYWADGEREWILHGDPVDPEELVDLARSIYC